MHCQFQHPFNDGESFIVNFSNEEVGKLTTLSNMIIDLGLEISNDIVPIQLDVLPESIELIRAIFAKNSISKSVIDLEIDSYLMENQKLDTQNLLCSMLIFIDFMNIDDKLENVIYDCVSYYLVNSKY